MAQAQRIPHPRNGHQMTRTSLVNRKIAGAESPYYVHHCVLCGHEQGIYGIRRFKSRGLGAPCQGTGYKT